VYVNGEQVVAPSALGKKTVEIKEPELASAQPHPVDLAVNYSRRGFPSPSASSNNTPDTLYQAIDGRVWFYPDVKNYWSSLGSKNAEDWFSIDFGTEKRIHSVKLYFFSDET